MEQVSFDKIKKSKAFVDDIRWDITPGIFLDPKSCPGDQPADLTHGYMLYVENVLEKPALVIMMLKRIVSKTVGYTFEVPEDLLKDAMNCEAAECIQGMYPLSEKLKDWLKKECGAAG